MHTLIRHQELSQKSNIIRKLAALETNWSSIEAMHKDRAGQVGDPAIAGANGVRSLAGMLCSLIFLNPSIA
jgi:hypothetical protein